MLATVQTIDQRSGPAIWCAGMTPKPAKPHVLRPLEPQAITVRADQDEEISPKARRRSTMPIPEDRQ